MNLCKVANLEAGTMLVFAQTVTHVHTITQAKFACHMCQI